MLFPTHCSLANKSISFEQLADGILSPPDGQPDRGMDALLDGLAQMYGANCSWLPDDLWRIDPSRLHDVVPSFSMKLRAIELPSVQHGYYLLALLIRRYLACMECNTYNVCFFLNALGRSRFHFPQINQPRLVSLISEDLTVRWIDHMQKSAVDE